MDADAKLLAEIAAALQANDKERLKELKSQLSINAWWRAWKERGGSIKDFVVTPNPYFEFKD